MGKVVGICVALLALAVGFVLLTEGRQTAALYYLYRSQPLPSQAAWAVIFLVSLALILSAVWLCYTLVQQRKTARALELRLDGVRDGVTGLAKTQLDAEAVVHQLVRTDPEDAMTAIQQRLTEAERFAQIQQSRHEADGLQSRLDNIRAQQQTLQERLVPVLETRRSIERLFMELGARQNDIDRTLGELASGDDAVALDIGLKNMMEFVRNSHARCDDIEAASKVIAGLKEDYAELAARLAPFAAAEGGVVSRVKELREAGAMLTLNIEALQQTPEGPLVERLQKFADDKRTLDARLSELNEQFSKLATLRKDIAVLFTGFNRALDLLSVARRGDSAADVDARVEELTKFIDATQAHIDDIAHRMVIFGQLVTKLGEVQSRLIPLESDSGGVMSVIRELKEIRDKIAMRIKRMEESDEGDLTERIRKFTDSKRELEERVTMLNEQFLKLAEIREDIAGLFQKLSSAVSASAS
jgi:prefoldin subunit 5